MRPDLLLPREPFGLADLEQLGITESELRCLERRGEVRRVVRAVFVSSDVPDTIELRARATAIAVEPHHVVTDRSAAWLHGVDTHVWAEHDTVPLLEVCALRGHEPTTIAGVDGRTRDLAPRDVTEVHGVRVTTPLRTALDLGCCLRRREAFAALVGLAREHGLSKRDLARELPRFRGRRGVVQLRELVGLLDLRLESERECWVLLAILDHGLAKPRPQHWIVIDGVPTYRLDLAYERRRVCVEYDGFDAHCATIGQREHDEDRRAWLRREGWTVIVVRRGDFSGEALDRWLRRLEEALEPAYSNRRW